MQRGFGLVLALLAVAMAGAGAAVVATAWTEQLQRQREDELLRIGELYARAIASYYLESPGAVKRYPPDLGALLDDPRRVVLTRHLRELYADPVTGGAEWGLVRAPDGGVMGVYSRSDTPPRRRVAVDLGISRLPASEHYSDWKFIPAL